MRDIVRKYKKAPAVRELALSLIRDLPPRAFAQEAALLHKYVQRAIRYAKDVRGVETVQTPIQTLRLKAGDCDDMSTLLATLLESIGHPTRFCAVGYNKHGFSHVAPQTKVGRNWVWLECTKPLAFGEAPQNQLHKITSLMRVHN